MQQPQTDHTQTRVSRPSSEGTADGRTQPRTSKAAAGSAAAEAPLSAKPRRKRSSAAGSSGERSGKSRRRRAPGSSGSRISSKHSAPAPPPPPPPPGISSRNLAIGAGALVGLSLAVLLLIRRFASRGTRQRTSSKQSSRAGQSSSSRRAGAEAAAGAVANGASVASSTSTQKSKTATATAKATAKPASGAATQTAGPCSKVKPSSKCVPLADGSACVVLRSIPADNSCLFNAVGYGMHKVKTRAPHLRDVVAQQVSSDREQYSTAFLGMTNDAYCAWIRQPFNWGGGIELSILAKGYGTEIAAWNIETCQCHVFGEESGYKKQVMVLYNGVHYDALAVAEGPNTDPSADVTDYNPNTKRGKLIIAAARKLVELQHRGSKFYKAKQNSMRLKCGECSALLQGSDEAQKHAKATGHTKFEQLAAVPTKS